MFISKVLLLIVSVSCFSYSAQESQVKLVMYTEGLNPDCQDFIINQLYPAYQKLKGFFLVELVPLGEAYKTDNGWICDHGPLECYLNSVDVCLISLKPSQSQLISFVTCHGKKTSINITLDETEGIVKQCAEENNLAWNDINKCVNDGTADALLLANIDRQLRAKPVVWQVPELRFYDIYDYFLMVSAKEDLVATVCSLLNGTKPSACDEFLNVKNLN